MDTLLGAIRDGLKRLRSVPIEPGDLTDETHKYQLNPPLTDDEIRRFEAEHGVGLPSDYRAFLMQLGNGGAGPGSGLEMLGHSMDSKAWSELPGMVGNLAVPFPYTVAWNEDNGRLSAS